MEINTQFHLEDWDIASDTSLLHLSYLIKTLLPVRWIGWNSGLASKSYKTFLSQNSSADNDSVIFIPTGSQAEGFGIPEAISRSSPSAINVLSDFDLLCIFKGMKFSTTKISESSEEFDGYLDYDYTSPGYARICLFTKPKTQALCVHDEDTGKSYFSSTNLSNQVFSRLSVSDPDRSRTKAQQGPAMTVTDPGMQILSKDVQVQPLNGIPMDIVPAFICAPWPEQARGLTARSRNSDWIKPQLAVSVIEDGCHIVGVPSKTSTKPDIEWRLSFSASEGRLAREAVTDHQRQCYIYLKILRHQMLKNENNVLSSYVFKSVFFYCCEDLPIENWRDFPGNCVLYMLDVLLECLKRKHVPTYFLPENNLVGHFNESEIEAAIRLVEKVRSDPITPIMNFTDDKCLLLHPLFGTFRMIAQPVLDDMKSFKQHRDKMLSIKRGIGESTSRMCLLYLREHADTCESLGLRKHQEAVRCLAEAFTQWLHVLFPGNTLGQVTNSFGLSVPSLEHSLRFFKAADSLSDEYPELAVCRGNLACMYHASAYADEGAVNTDNLRRAGDLFEQVYNEAKGNVVDYATFLLQQNQHAKAKKILEDYINSDHSKDKSLYSYSKKEIRTLDDRLQKHIAANGKVTSDGLSIAYYYMVKCLLVLNPGDKAFKINKILEILQTHEKDKRTECSFNFSEQARDLVLQHNVYVPALSSCTKTSS